MLIKFGKPGGGDLYIEQTLVRLVAERTGGGGTVYFDKEHAIQVSEGAADIAKMLNAARR